MPDLATVRLLTDAIGSRIKRIRRIHYVYRGVPDTEFGPLELTFDSGVLLLEVAADGEALRVCTDAWQDPFAGPLSEENRAFVEQSGKWAAFDISAQGAFATLIDDTVASVEPVLAVPGKVTGMILRTGSGGVIRVDVEADELFLNEMITGRQSEHHRQP